MKIKLNIIKIKYVTLFQSILSNVNLNCLNNLINKHQSFIYINFYVVTSQKYSMMNLL